MNRQIFSSGVISAGASRLSVLFCGGLCLLLTGQSLPAQAVNPFSAQPPAILSDQQPEGRVANPDDISAWLEDIPLKTRRSGILPEETELYYQVLAHVRDMDSVQLKQSARKFMEERWQNSRYHQLPFEKFPVFVDMYQNPELYKGRPVTMRGHLQRTVYSPAGENEFGIDKIAEAWLFTEDSQTNPTVVLTTTLPPNFPVGEHVVDRVVVTGYIYRMYTYQARDAGRFAPMLMAHSIEWTPPAEVGKNDHSWVWIIFGGIVLLLGASLIGTFWALLAKARNASFQQNLPRDIVSLPDARSEVKFPGKNPSRSGPNSPDKKRE